MSVEDVSAVLARPGELAENARDIRSQEAASRADRIPFDQVAQDGIATFNRHDVSHETDFPRVGAVARMTLSRRGLAKAGLRCPLSPARVTAGFFVAGDVSRQRHLL